MRSRITSFGGRSAADSQMFRARLYGFQGKTEQAVGILEGLVAADPENENARRMLDRMKPPSAQE